MRGDGFRSGTARDRLTLSTAQQEITMDKDRVEGSAKQIKGNVKEAVGKVTGDSKTEAEGKADKAEGKVQNTIGGIKDKARELLDDK
jgi:uncharacterized protein YjbJ (UPF0337 family)